MMLILSEASNFKEPALMEAVSFDAEIGFINPGRSEGYSNRLTGSSESTETTM